MHSHLNFPSFSFVLFSFQSISISLFICLFLFHSHSSFSLSFFSVRLWSVSRALWRRFLFLSLCVWLCALLWSHLSSDTSLVSPGLRRTACRDSSDSLSGLCSTLHHTLQRRAPGLSQCMHTRVRSLPRTGEWDAEYSCVWSRQACVQQRMRRLSFNMLPEQPYTLWIDWLLCTYLVLYLITQVIISSHGF